MNLLKSSACAIFVLCSTGCAVSPKKVVVYDEDCQIVSEKLVLDYHGNKMLRIEACENQDCIDQIVDQALMKIPLVAMETIVAGSVVVAGNTVYWLQKQGQCKEIKKSDK